MMEEKQLTAEATKITVLGMSLRDYYAGMVMQSVLTSFTGTLSSKAIEIAADKAFTIADTMIKRRNQ